jgi:hypothetical protein
MKNLPVNMQTFSDLMTQNYLYVDKTKEIYNLFARGGKYYFLSRPRRFGKTLLVSILKEIFSGNKQLFKDLWIYDKIQWEVFPVIQGENTGQARSRREVRPTIFSIISMVKLVYSKDNQLSNSHTYHQYKGPFECQSGIHQGNWDNLPISDLPLILLQARLLTMLQNSEFLIHSFEVFFFLASISSFFKIYCCFCCFIRNS